MKKWTKRELILLVVIVMLLLSGYSYWGGYLRIGVNEQIKVICPTYHYHPDFSGPFENRRGEVYWDIGCQTDTIPGIHK